MEIRKLKNGWQFVNNWRSNRSGFVHETTLFNDNGYKVGEYKCQYYNRTWESYTFQSSMRGAIAKVMRYNITRYLENYKYTNNITRFKKGQREELIAEYKESNDLMLDLEQTLQAIRDREFN